MPINKYFIAIIPDSEISSGIISFRKKYLEGLNVNDEHKKFPHITLQHTFSREEGIENELRPYLQFLSGSIEPFEITVSGVGHFDYRVIFIGVNENPELLKLHQGLKNILLTYLKFTSKEVAVEYHLHITLEKKITKSDFRKYWFTIHDKKFEGKFRCSSFSLMKHNGRVWEEASKYNLKM